MKQLTHAERQQIAKEAIELMIKLLPPEEFGENDQCEQLHNKIVELGELSETDLEEIMECGSGD